MPPDFTLAARTGARPRTTPTNPHSQLDQHPDPGVIDSLARTIFALPGVSEAPSAISVPGARALWLDPALARGPRHAFLIGTEFAHIHPLPDGSLHVALPPDVAALAIDRGWAEEHPVARLGLIPPNIVMIYAPRDALELGAVAGLVGVAHAFARGEAG